MLQKVSLIRIYRTMQTTPRAFALKGWMYLNRDDHERAEQSFIDALKATRKMELAREGLA
jgi:Tfp pilus assembly protein PilF